MSELPAESPPRLPIALIVACASLLFASVFPWPYGYFTFLRIVSFATFALGGTVLYRSESGSMAVLFALLAVLFNPLYPIHLPRELWSVIDLGAALLLVVQARALSGRSVPKAS